MLLEPTYMNGKGTARIGHIVPERCPGPRTLNSSCIFSILFPGNRRKHAPWRFPGKSHT